MPRNQRTNYTDMPSAEVPLCEWCPPKAKEPHEQSRAQFRAHLHWLRDFSDQDSLKRHLAMTLTDSLQGPEYKAGRIESILSWWQSIQRDFARDLDESGREVQPWESWAMAQAKPPCHTVDDLHIRLARAGLRRAPEVYDYAATH